MHYLLWYNHSVTIRQLFVSKVYTIYYTVDHWIISGWTLIFRDVYYFIKISALVTDTDQYRDSRVEVAET